MGKEEKDEGSFGNLQEVLKGENRRRVLVENAAVAAVVVVISWFSGGKLMVYRCFLLMGLNDIASGSQIHF